MICTIGHAAGASGRLVRKAVLGQFSLIVCFADGADFQHEFSNVRFSQALHQAVARLTENQTQKLRATADAEMKVIIVPGTKFTYPGESTNSR